MDIFNNKQQKTVKNLNPKNHVENLKNEDTISEKYIYSTNDR